MSTDKLVERSHNNLVEPEPVTSVTFGAVYEYRDRTGRPVYVGGTSDRPESIWRDDYQTHQSVRTLANEGGCAKVVWAGVGCGSCGPGEMAAAREAVSRDRAARQQIIELHSAKPYSRHSALM